MNRMGDFTVLLDHDVESAGIHLCYGHRDRRGGRFRYQIILAVPGEAGALVDRISFPVRPCGHSADLVPVLLECGVGA
jgi:hypothetical protein